MIRIIFIFYLLVCISFNVYAAEKLTEQKIRQIVIDVIKENPKLIYDVLTAYIKKQREENEIEAAFKRRISGIPISSYNPSKGPKDAPITIIEFTDFQCPFCKKGSLTMEELMKLYPNKIRLIFKNLPLSSIHKEAMSAAKAAMAANKQGMFWPYHDILFENSSNLNKDLYIQIARILKLDIKKFKSDMNSSEIDKQVQYDIKIAKKFGIKETPVFIINGVVIKGAKSLEYFKKVINRLLEEKKKLNSKN